MEKRFSCTVTLYIENAFNSIYWSQIKQLLSKYRLPYMLSRILKNFLKDRTVLLTSGNTRMSNQGVQQGSSSGPALWLFIIIELLEETSNRFGAYDEIKIQVNADDIVVM
ncbi:hypothetical protein AVEN_153048-1 [Araneus ventricosus]|uniref:Reverse transcriptase domain-containing protein n=1 Tax=Araneus ventricosus TaxID=182803 RepID=A0A4Y2MVY9_ARAVE|nr:hypothetical protein AVEN_153048-1 [Araneus ventricosus]